jgi:hypothetical protein
MYVLNVLPVAPPDRILPASFVGAAVVSRPILPQCNPSHQAAAGHEAWTSIAVTQGYSTYHKGWAQPA